MKFYFASRYSRRGELLGYRSQLNILGYMVTSRWLDGEYSTDEAGRSLEAPLDERKRVATEDLADVLRANVVVAFTEMPRSHPGRGGRHVELGVAIGTGKRIIVIGPRENVFCCLPEVEVYPTWDDFTLRLR
jgi:hypothetical protein